MAQSGQGLAHAVLLGEVAIRHGDPGLVAELGQHYTPGVDDEAAPVALPGLAVATALGRGHHEALVLDGARPQQGFPMIAPGPHRKGRGHLKISFSSYDELDRLLEVLLGD